MLSCARWIRLVNFQSEYMWLISKSTVHFSHFCAQRQLYGPGKCVVNRFKQNPVQMLQVAIMCRYMPFESTWKMKHAIRKLFVFLCIRIYVFSIGSIWKRGINASFVQNQLTNMRTFLNINTTFIYEYHDSTCVSIGVYMYVYNIRYI